MFIADGFDFSGEDAALLGAGEKIVVVTLVDCTQAGLFIVINQLVNRCSLMGHRYPLDV